MKISTIAIGAATFCVAGIMGFTGLTAFIGLPSISATHPAAAKYRPVSAAGNADIKVLGTSNLHNWSMEAKDITCSRDSSLKIALTKPICMVIFL